MRALVKLFGWPEFKAVEKSVAQVDMAVLARYEGKYRYVDYLDYGAEITKDGEHLFLQESPLGIRFQLYPESETVFFCLDRPEEIAFFEHAGGKVETMMIGKYSYLERVE